MLHKTLETKESLKGAVRAIEFEKDDDTNFHIDFIAASANLRARNYYIQEAPRHEIKLTAGKIIPAIATTTAMVVGIVGFEMMKYFAVNTGLIARDPMDVFKNSSCNLAIPTWNFNFVSSAIEFKDVEPGENSIYINGAKALEIKDPKTGEMRKITKWDRILFKSPTTIEQIVNYFKENYQVDVYMFICQDKTFYHSKSRWQNVKEAAAKRFKMTIEEAYENESKTVLDESRKVLTISIMGKQIQGNKPVQLPDLKYIRSQI